MTAGEQVVSDKKSIIDKTEPDSFFGVMVSSTFLDLSEHRKALMEELTKNKLFPICMEHYTLIPDDTIIGSSIRMVRQGSAYIGLIGHRYGNIPNGSMNPNGNSISCLEFEEAQKLNRPILIFVMGEDHPITAKDVETDLEKRKKLEDFRKRAKEGSI